VTSKVVLPARYSGQKLVAKGAIWTIEEGQQTIIRAKEKLAGTARPGAGMRATSSMGKRRFVMKVIFVVRTGFILTQRPR